MRRYLAERGEFGAMPGWYEDCKAAGFHGMNTLEYLAALEEGHEHLRYWALVGLSAENEARQLAEERASR